MQFIKVDKKNESVIRRSLTLVFFKKCLYFLFLPLFGKIVVFFGTKLAKNLNKVF